MKELEKMNLYEKIQNVMLSDDENTDEIGQGLLEIYKTANRAEKELIDRVFMALTGWSLKTLRGEK